MYVNKQAVGKVPTLRCSKRFCLQWVCIMIQMKILRRRQMLVTDEKPGFTQLQGRKCLIFFYTNGFFKLCLGFMQTGKFDKEPFLFCTFLIVHFMGVNGLVCLSLTDCFFH